MIFNQPWAFSDAITALKLIRRLHATDGPSRATLAADFLSNRSSDQGLIRVRMQIVDAERHQGADEAEPLLVAIAIKKVTEAADAF